ncbi:transposase, is630 family [Shigella sonnei str. Moseley]|nr:transposase, is630 family [Shigella sonnei str. Moseley]
MPIIAPISRDERRLMQKAIHKTHDKNYARRLTAMLMLHRGDRVSDVARTLCCAVPLLDAGLTGSRSRVLRD